MKVTQDHFDLITRIITELRASEWDDGEEIADYLALQFAEAFQHATIGKGRTFQRTQFLKACGYNGQIAHT